MLSCMYAGREHQPCGMLSGEYSPVFRRPRFDPDQFRGGLQAWWAASLTSCTPGGKAEFGVDVGEVGLHGAG
jgi:hypothetical protein